MHNRLKLNTDEVTLPRVMSVVADNSLGLPILTTVYGSICHEKSALRSPRLVRKTFEGNRCIPVGAVSSPPRYNDSFPSRPVICRLATQMPTYKQSASHIAPALRSRNIWMWVVNLCVRRCVRFQVGPPSEPCQECCTDHPGGGL
jgi:hypothetical protein